MQAAKIDATTPVPITSATVCVRAEPGQPFFAAGLIPRPTSDYITNFIDTELQRHGHGSLVDDDLRHFHWFLPTSGDGRTIMGRGHSLPLVGQRTALPRRPARAAHQRAAAQERPPDIEYLAQVARSAEQLGFEAVLTPTGTWCEDAWLATAALIGQTTRLKFLVAFRPGLISPTLAAQMAATYQRISRGRLLLNVVTGGQADEQRRFGDHLSHDERYARTARVPGHRAGRLEPASRSTSPASTTRSTGPP